MGGVFAETDEKAPLILGFQIQTPESYLSD